MFHQLKDKVQNKTICFAAPTNSIITRNKKYKEQLESIFKQVDFLTVSSLLNEKLRYTNSGDSYFEILEKKKNPIFQFDIIIIDEISMVHSDQIEYIFNNKHKIKLCILIGDKNQLNPIKSEEHNIFNNNPLNLINNMRCSNNNINLLYTFIIEQLSIIDNTVYDFNIFIKLFYMNIFKYKNDPNITIFTNLDEFINHYCSLYKSNTSIIGNYTNNTCNKLNTQIKNTIIQTENLELFDQYYIGQQIIFKEPYENWHISDFATIKKIYNTPFKYPKITYNKLIQFQKDIKINIVLPENTTYLSNNYDSTNTKLYKSQELFNYLIHITNTTPTIINIFKALNNFPKIDINSITLHDDSLINVIHSNYYTEYDSYLKTIYPMIKTLLKIKYTQNNKSYKKLFNDYIIQGLWNIINKYRCDIFAKIDSGFACTIHKLQGASIYNMFVNFEDIFSLFDNQKNKLKCIYTAITRTSSQLIFYLPLNPLCKCNIFAKHKISNNESYWICKKCGFYETNDSDNSNCSKCINCYNLYHNTYINQYNLCLQCTKEV